MSRKTSIIYISKFMIKKIYIKIFFIFSFFFSFNNLGAQIKLIYKTRIVEFELSELGVSKENFSFLKQVDSLILQSKCTRLNNKKFNNYSMSINELSDSIYSIKVVLTQNVRDSISDLGYFRKGNSLFIVRGKNPNDLFFVTRKKKKWMYKAAEGDVIETLTPREKIEGSPLTWYFKYCDGKFHLVNMDCL